MNFLGLEIRRPCVEEAFKKMEKYGIRDNVHFVALNANVDMDRVVKDVQEHSEIVRCEYIYGGRRRDGGREGGRVCCEIGFLEGDIDFMHSSLPQPALSLPPFLYHRLRPISRPALQSQAQKAAHCLTCLGCRHVC